MSFGTKYLIILCWLKIPNEIVGVISAISLDSKNIFKYQNAIEGQFLSQKSCFCLLFAIFDHFSWEKNFNIKEIF
jgi:hypothetical protein